MEDNYRHKGLRNKLIETLQEKGITDANVLSAIRSVPRHWFMDSSFLQFAYEDKAFPIGSGQTISQPYTVAFQTSLLNVKKGDKVLEIGTGSGYQACVLIAMGAKVYTIERQRKLYLRTKAFMQKIGYRVKYATYGDGFLGLPAFAPFDKIIVTAAAPVIPQALKEQLKPGGILVIPKGEGTQKMLRITKIDEHNFKTEEFGDFKFVPMLQGKADD